MERTIFIDYSNIANNGQYIDFPYFWPTHLVIQYPMNGLTSNSVPGFAATINPTSADSSWPDIMSEWNAEELQFCNTQSLVFFGMLVPKNAGTSGRSCSMSGNTGSVGESYIQKYVVTFCWGLFEKQRLKSRWEIFAIWLWLYNLS